MYYVRSEVGIPGVIEALDELTEELSWISDGMDEGACVLRFIAADSNGGSIWHLVRQKVTTSRSPPSAMRSGSTMLRICKLNRDDVE